MTVPRYCSITDCHRAAAFGDVALQPPDEPRVVVGVDEDLHVHQLAQRGISIDEDAFDDDRAARRDGLGVGCRAWRAKSYIGTSTVWPARSASTCWTSRSVSSESGWS